MKILHVIRGLANSSGTTHIVNPLSEAQSKLGAEVSVAYVDKPNAAAVEPDPALVKSWRFPLSVRLNNPGLSAAYARALPELVAAADVVHVHAIWNFPSWWAMRSAVRARTPFIVAPQGSLDPWALRQNRWGKRLYGALTEMPLMRRADCMQALSNKEEQQFRQAGISGPVRRIPNGIDADMFVNGAQRGDLARQLELPDGSQTLLFLSRVHPKKGLDLLLQAFAAVAERFPERVLIVAGNDAGSGYLETMRALATQLGIAARCRFLGEVSGQTKRDTLMGADAYALVSHSEGLPVASVEALGAGLPCVLSHECNLPEVEQAEAGWLVAPNVNEASKALDQLFSAPQEASRRGENARNLVSLHFTWDRIAEQTLAVYQQMVSGAIRHGGAA